MRDGSDAAETSAVGDLERLDPACGGSDARGCVGSPIGTVRLGNRGFGNMAHVRVIVLRTAGTNCDEETAHAWGLVGATAERVHVNRLVERPERLDDYQILTIPGGFSYGDDVAGGKILANQIVHHLVERVRSFIRAGKLVLGICNGFQVLVKAGLLPDGEDGNGGASSGRFTQARQKLTLTTNDSGRFEDRWVHLRVATDRCVLLEKDDQMSFPVAHGEGKLVTNGAATLAHLRQNGYVDADGRAGPYPVNPNGSEDDIAGLTDTTGRVLGLMPHPERHVHPAHHPCWTRRPRDREPDGLRLFRRAVAYLQE